MSDERPELARHELKGSHGNHNELLRNPLRIDQKLLRIMMISRVNFRNPKRKGLAIRAGAGYIFRRTQKGSDTKMTCLHERSFSASISSV